MMYARIPLEYGKRSWSTDEVDKHSSWTVVAFFYTNCCCHPAVSCCYFKLKVNWIEGRLLIIIIVGRYTANHQPSPSNLFESHNILKEVLPSTWREKSFSLSRFTSDRSSRMNLFKQLRCCHVHYHFRVHVSNMLFILWAVSFYGFFNYTLTVWVFLCVYVCVCNLLLIDAYHWNVLHSIRKLCLSNMLIDCIRLPSRILPSNRIITKSDKRTNTECMS